MAESGYYPTGTEDDPRAPWNEEKVPKNAFKVFVSQTLSKELDVITDDYTMEVDEDEDGFYEYPYTQLTDWGAAYSKDGHYTPSELIDTFRCLLDEIVDKNILIVGYSKNKCQHLINECKNWSKDDTEVMEG